jgi:hypothetical protein
MKVKANKTAEISKQIKQLIKVRNELKDGANGSKKIIKEIRLLRFMMRCVSTFAIFYELLNIINLLNYH